MVEVIARTLKAAADNRAMRLDIEYLPMIDVTGGDAPE